ncbi:MAG: amidohydrolase family protein [Stomatobaculum sp.]|nr:amidohydrolase family protein [Stomatobaculum sp.]
MIIDIHTHVFPDKIAAKTVEALSHVSHSRPFTDGSASGLLSAMQRSGIDRSVILPVATSPRQVIHVNDASAALNETFGEAGLHSFGCIHPEFEEYRAELARIKELGLKGIKIHPVYQGADIDSPPFLRILERAAELGLIVLIHAGLDIGYPGEVRCSPKMIRHAMDEICGSSDSFVLIAAHMGGWRNWDEVPEYLADTAVCLDTAFSTGSICPLNDGHYHPEDLPMMTQADFMRLYDVFGPDRILFGTDSPWSSPEESLAFLRSLELPEEDLAKILGGNAEKLLAHQ